MADAKHDHPPLIAAIAEDDINTVTNLLARNFRIDEEAQHIRSFHGLLPTHPLLETCRWGHVAILKLLLEVARQKSIDERWYHDAYLATVTNGKSECKALMEAALLERNFSESLPGPDVAVCKTEPKVLPNGKINILVGRPGGGICYREVEVRADTKVAVLKSIMEGSWDFSLASQCFLADTHSGIHRLQDNQRLCDMNVINNTRIYTTYDFRVTSGTWDHTTGTLKDWIWEDDECSMREACKESWQDYVKSFQSPRALRNI